MNLGDQRFAIEIAESEETRIQARSIVRLLASRSVATRQRRHRARTRSGEILGRRAGCWEEEASISPPPCARPASVLAAPGLEVELVDIVLRKSQRIP